MLLFVLLIDNSTLFDAVVAEKAEVGMMEEHFEIDAWKSTQQYGFRKGLQLIGDEGYQAAKNELEVNLLGRVCINMLSWKDFTWDIKKQALGYLMFLNRKQNGKMKGRDCADGRSQREYNY